MLYTLVRDPGTSCLMPEHYKSFIIEEFQIDVCNWDEPTADFIVQGQQTVYKIRRIDSKLIYGVKRSIAMAKKAIDKYGSRWLTD
ncbi:hypothetical protein WBJ53_18965 [Spirosoma sp. SC4-14]|uniref:hypothetical protein n=1 Tax=Spirosoma sp. SC4-14 TaxID=3128900 RepID=UPI0030D27190